MTDRDEAIRARAEASTPEPCKEECPHRDECMPRYFDTQDCISAWKGTGLTPTEAVVLKDDVKRLTAALAAMTAERDEWQRRAKAAEDRLPPHLSDGYSADDAAFDEEYD